MHSPGSDAHPDDSKVDVSVIVPVYDNATTIPALLERLERFHELHPRMEAVLVVDGSPDESATILARSLGEASFPAQLHLHARNFGAFSAIRTGLAHSRGASLVCMAADLQEPEELILQLIEAVGEGDQYDIAIGTRIGRDDPFVSRTLSSLYWRLHRRLVDGNVPKGGVDVFSCTKQVSSELLRLTESRSSLIGLLFWVGFRRIEVPYRRVARRDGKSGWSLRRRFSYAFDSIFSFTAVPITLLLLLGFVGSIVMLSAASYVAVMRFTGQIAEAGYAGLMVAILLSTFLILLGLGIVASYVWRAYENSKGRPEAVVMRRQDFTPSDWAP
jgi:glycosyltransferase involved in cell wall biosynthesis